jgi:hypothetical protein
MTGHRRVQLDTVSVCLRAPWSQKQGLFGGYEVFREGAKNCARGGRAPQSNFWHTDTVSSCARHRRVRRHRRKPGEPTAAASLSGFNGSNALENLWRPAAWQKP